MLSELFKDGMNPQQKTNRIKFVVASILKKEYTLDLSKLFVLVKTQEDKWIIWSAVMNMVEDKKCGLLIVRNKDTDIVKWILIRDTNYSLVDPYFAPSEIEWRKS